MENLTIESTKSTPKVIGNAQTGNLTLSGNLFPENSIIFFKPIYSWITELSKKNDLLKLEIAKISNNKSFLEGYARENYGYIKENELFFQIIKDEK